MKYAIENARAGSWNASDIVEVVSGRLKNNLLDQTGNGLSHPPAMRFVDYQIPIDVGQAAIASVPRLTEAHIYAVRYALASKVLPQVMQTVEVAEQVRVQLMGIHKKLAGGAALVSSRFSGKDRHGSPLRDHGHQHSFILPQDSDGDGRIDQILVYCRHPFDDTERIALDRLQSLWRSGGKPDLRCVPVEWGGARPKAIFEYESLTPFVPPRHFKPKREEFDEWLQKEVARECANHGLPAPVAILLIPELTLQVGRSIRWAEFTRNRKQDAVRSGLGLRIRFGEPVQGPVVLGYGCHFGLGQFKPIE